MTPKFLVMAVVAVAIAVVAPSRSDAAFTITLRSGAFADVVIYDNNIAPSTNSFDLSPSLRFIRTADAIADPLSGLSFAGYRIGLASESQATGMLLANTSSSIFNVSGGSPLTIIVSDDGFTSPGTSGSALLLMNKLTLLQFTGIASVSAFSTASPVLSTTPTVTLNTLDGTSSQSGFNRTGTPYTITQTFVVNLTAGNSITFNGSASVVNATPAPAGLLLAAFGIPAFGLLRRFGRKSGVAEVAVAA